MLQLCKSIRDREINVANALTPREMNRKTAIVAKDLNVEFQMYANIECN